VSHPAATIIPGPRTCGTCGYANDDEAGIVTQTLCTNAASWHHGRLMPKIEGCTQWYPKEDR
jgi:hypothetical protein